jgi:hypothetical protein
LDGGEDGLPSSTSSRVDDGSLHCAAINFTGSSQYAGTEIDVGLRYSILPGLFWTPRFGWAFWEMPEDPGPSRSDAWTFANRIIYVF